MLESAKSAGLASEKTMWAGLESVSEMLCVMKREHPDMYWKFIREQHGVIYGNHYSEDFAMYDVEQMAHTNKEGKKESGGYWTLSQIEDATRSMQFPSGTNKWDKYVAFNSAHSDLCRKFDDDTILKIAHTFFFADEDWPTDTKIWDYMCCKAEEE